MNRNASGTAANIGRTEKLLEASAIAGCWSSDQKKNFEIDFVFGSSPSCIVVRSNFFDHQTLETK